MLLKHSVEHLEAHVDVLHVVPHHDCHLVGLLVVEDGEEEMGRVRAELSVEPVELGLDSLLQIFWIQSLCGRNTLFRFDQLTLFIFLRRIPLVLRSTEFKQLMPRSESFEADIFDDWG